MRITSQAFTDGSKIPDKYSKDGENRIPPIHFEEVPSKARSLALILTITSFITKRPRTMARQVATL